MKKEEIDLLLENVNKEAKEAIKEDIEAAISGLMTSEELATKLEGIASQEAIDNLTTAVEEQGLEMKRISKGIEKAQTLPEELLEKKEEIIKIAKGMKPGESVELKTLVQNSTVSGSQVAFDLPDIGQMAHRKLTAYDLFPKLRLGNNDNATVRYYDWTPASVTRAAAMRAEGVAFPESVAAWTKYSIDLKKIGDTIPVTEEFFEDNILFASELGMFLQTNVKIVEDTQLVTGDGTGNNLTGVYTSATAYTAAAAGITDASIYDLIVKMKETISTSYGSKYIVDFVLMNIADINEMKLKKDANNNYVLPPFVDRNGNQVDGVNVIECNAVTANTLVIGDRRFARIYEKTGYDLSKGMVDTQFTEDEITLKVRKRILMLVREVDKTGFLKCTDIDAALVTLAS